VKKLSLVATSLFAMTIAGCGTVADRTASVEDLLYEGQTGTGAGQISVSVESPNSMTAKLRIGTADTTICDARHSYDAAIAEATYQGLSKWFTLVDSDPEIPSLSIVYKGIEGGGGCSLQGQVTLRCTQSVTFTADVQLNFGQKILLKEVIQGNAQITEGDFFSACSALGGLHQRTAKSAFSTFIKKTTNAINEALKDNKEVGT